jgi:hypothetical protein
MAAEVDWGAEKSLGGPSFTRRLNAYLVDAANALEINRVSLPFTYTVVSMRAMLSFTSMAVGAAGRTSTSLIRS